MPAGIFFVETRGQSGLLRGFNEGTLLEAQALSSSISMESKDSPWPFYGLVGSNPAPGA
jgi:hypothetical protein